MLMAKSFPILARSKSSMDISRFWMLRRKMVSFTNDNLFNDLDQRYKPNMIITFLTNSAYDISLL